MIAQDTLRSFLDDLRTMRDRHIPKFVQQVEDAVRDLELAAGLTDVPIGTRPTFRQRWRDPGDDPGMQLFHQAYLTTGFELAPGATVLEIGSEETIFAEAARRADPTLQVLALDWRATDHADGVLRLTGNVLMAPITIGSLDWVLSLSALEHIGLGHYDHDPVDPFGDRLAFEQIARWLKPGGSVYFDVPWHPSRTWTHGTEYRVYDQDRLTALWRGLDLAVRWQGFSPPCPIALLPPPADLRDCDFWYTALWLTKGTA